MTYFRNLLISIDQFFNTISGGNPDCTISAHVGLMAFSQAGKWRFIRDVIDYTFNPIEQQHCLDSWLNESDQDNKDNFFTTAFVALIGCVLLFIPIRILGALKHG